MASMEDFAVLVADDLNDLETRILKDTGERDVTSLFPGISGGSVFMSRTGNDVTFRFEAVTFASAGTQSGIGATGTGFRPRPTYSYFSTAQRLLPASPIRGLRVSRFGSFDFYDADPTHSYYATLTWKTFDGFPATLPGTPA